MKAVRIITLSAAAVAALVLTVSASAMSLHVIGSGHSAGDYAATTASGGKNKIHAAYVRGYGRGLSAVVSATCSRGFSAGSKTTTVSHMVSGRLYRVRLPFAGDCTVAASLSGQGSIRLQILA